MSSRFMKSVQSINQHSEYENRIKTELDIVSSYLKIDEWTEENFFAEMLADKLQGVKKFKEKVMRFYNISSHSEVVSFRCQVCKQVFDQPTALSGHISKAHPDFKKDQAIIKQRQQKVIKQSSIQKIKKERQSLHLQATGIHRQYSRGISY